MFLVTPTYFAPISQYALIAKNEHLTLEVEDNYQKQTYRNRCYIYGANGKQLLSIPVSKIKSSSKIKTKDTLIERGSNWQSQHLKSLQAAYRNSPFFEFYIDELQPIFNKKYTYLLDVNIDTFIILNKALEINPTFSKSTEYIATTEKNDFRFLSEVKSLPAFHVEKYTQMFDDKHGFIPNLSILDLLFMEGPNAINILEKTRKITHP